ncbi:FAD-dependent oxidoreductase [Porticoccus sp. GXU_MW_L64]
MSVKKILILLVVAAVLCLYFFTDLGDYITPTHFQQLYADEPVLTMAIFFAAYVLLCSLPVAALLTVMGGMVFGVTTGTLLVSFASTAGATVAFLVARGLLGDVVQKKFGSYLETVNRGVEKDGAFYLFSLRLIPAVPFSVINPVMGLTKMKPLTFYLVSQIGMLPGTFVYVNAGAQLGAVDEFSVAGVLTPGLIASFVLLAILPFIARAIVGSVQKAKVYKGYKKPKSFDTNMAVIGGGSAGLVSSYIAAAVKAKVTLIERHKMGGDCLNTGCVPSKALIRSAKIVKEVRNAEHYGVSAGEPKVDFAKVMERVGQVVKDIEPHDSIERYTGLGVDCVTGDAKIISPWEVQVGDQVITTKNIVIASGARPFVPPIPGIDQVDYLTSDNLWDLRELPERLLVLGGGPIGCELAQSFQRLGAKVTQVDMAPRLMPREDADVSEFVMEKFASEGIDVRVNHKTVAFEVRDGENVAILESGDDKVEVSFDKVLVAVGRKANVTDMGLEELGIDTLPQGTVQVDDYLRTRYPNIYACGDVAGPYQFTHTAAHQAWYAAVNALFSGLKSYKVDYSVIPWATFVDPEVARVGLSEAEAQEKGIEYEVTKYGIDDLDRAIADGEAQGFVKVLTPPGKDKILGATIVGYHASDLITEFVTGMKRNIGLNKILGTIHIYPTVSEANKYAAGEWKRANAPEKALQWLFKFHNWRRGASNANAAQSAATAKQ